MKLMKGAGQLLRYDAAIIPRTDSYKFYFATRFGMYQTCEVWRRLTEARNGFGQHRTGCVSHQFFTVSEYSADQL